jgi:hypothetical protein
MGFNSAFKRLTNLHLIILYGHSAQSVYDCKYLEELTTQIIKKGVRSQVKPWVKRQKSG